MRRAASPRRWDLPNFSAKTPAAWLSWATTFSTNIEEKPKHPKSNLAVAGIYLYPPDVFEVVRTLKPSGRGELEITDVNNHYLRQGRLRSHTLKGYWTDAGTLPSLHVANELVRQKMPQF